MHCYQAVLHGRKEEGTCAKLVIRMTWLGGRFFNLVQSPVIVLNVLLILLLSIHNLYRDGTPAKIKLTRIHSLNLSVSHISIKQGINKKLCKPINPVMITNSVVVWLLGHSFHIYSLLSTLPVQCSF